MHQRQESFQRTFLVWGTILYFFLNYLDVSYLITPDNKSLELLETALSEGEILDKYTNFEAQIYQNGAVLTFLSRSPLQK